MNPSHSIEFFNRYTGRIEPESVYGLGFVRWTYDTMPGRLSLHALAKRALFSRWYGWRMDRPASRAKVLPFIRDFGLDPAEFSAPPESFRTFNEFFYRKLKPAARPIAPDPAAVFPADGRHLGFQDLSRTDGIFVKGAVFKLEELLQSTELAARYRTGALVISRLCPVDYHRFHFPVAGVPDAARILPGPLFSVNPIALRQNIHIFSQNKRALSTVDSPAFGRVLLLEVGATCVGSMEYTYAPGRPVAKGAEKGFFKFGGSSTITIFEPGRIRLADDLVAHSREHRELYARMGDALGTPPR
ncbi:phosphatidylserine decarboxylase proenzyme [Verrucomicrobiota bacterium]|nr:phosphatidylserine decarboxylase proenzyme [Verrucomicrobiota bacterium]